MHLHLALAMPNSMFYIKRKNRLINDTADSFKSNNLKCKICIKSGVGQF